MNNQNDKQKNTIVARSTLKKAEIAKKNVFPIDIKQDFIDPDDVTFLGLRSYDENGETPGEFAIGKDAQRHYVVGRFDTDGLLDSRGMTKSAIESGEIRLYGEKMGNIDACTLYGGDGTEIMTLAIEEENGESVVAVPLSALSETEPTFGLEADGCDGVMNFTSSEVRLYSSDFGSQTPASPDKDYSYQDYLNGSKLVDLYIDTDQVKLEYFEGEVFDASKLNVIAIYEDGNEEPVYNFRWAPKGKLTATQTQITVMYGSEATATIPITVKKVVPIDLKVVCGKTTYSEREKFDVSTTTVQMLYNDGHKEIITDYDYTPKGSLTTANNTIKIAYGGFEKTVRIYVSETPAVRMEITQAPDKVIYTEGESFDKTGMRVKLYYEDGFAEEIHDYIVTYGGNLTTDRSFVQISSKGQQKYQRITVEPKQDAHTSKPSVSSGVNGNDDVLRPGKLSIKSRPNRTEYHVGEQFNPLGMCVSYKESSGTEYDVTDYVVSPTILLAGCKEVFVRYKGVSAAVAVNVHDSVITEKAPAALDLEIVPDVDGSLCLATGDLGLTVPCMEFADGCLSHELTLVHKQSAEDFGCGKNWRLDLHRTLRRSDKDGKLCNHLTQTDITDKDTVDYIYTDENGMCYSFDEVFYIKSGAQKIKIDRANVGVNADGGLYYHTAGVIYNDPVVRELKTASGLKLSAQLDKIDGVELIEQRNNDIVKLEAEIAQYEDAVKELDYNLKIHEYGSVTPNTPSCEGARIELNKKNPFLFPLPADKWGDPSHTLEERIKWVQNKINTASLGNSALTDGMSDEQAARAVDVWYWQKYESELNEQYENLIKETQDAFKTETFERYSRQKSDYEIKLEQKRHQLKCTKRRSRSCI